MLPKKRKLGNARAIERVFKKGKRASSIFFKMIFSVREAHSPIKGPLFAVSVPNAIKANSVQRNRIRRRVFGIIEKNCAFAKEKNYDIVIIVRDRGVAMAESAKLTAEFKTLFEKLP